MRKIFVVAHLWVCFFICYKKCRAVRIREKRFFMFDVRKMQEQIIYDAVKIKSSDETAKEVVFGKEARPEPEENPKWVKAVMRRMENRFDKATLRQIRMNCQCGYGMEEKLALLQKLVAASSGLKEFAGQKEAKAAGLSYKDGAVYLSFAFCPCPMLAEVDRLEANTWCLCTLGYSKVLFEKAFGCKVEVELLKSIKMGDESCLQKIVFKDLHWEQAQKDRK